MVGRRFSNYPLAATATLAKIGMQKTRAPKTQRCHATEHAHTHTQKWFKVHIVVGDAAKATLQNWNAQCVSET
jgi:hypothetical protein